MTTVREAITARLLAAAGVTAIAGDRVTWLVRDQGAALPALVLTLVSQQREQLIDGDEDMLVSRVQVDGFADRQLDAVALGEAARAVLLPEAEVGGILFWQGSAEGPRDLGEQSDSEGFIHRSNFDVVLRHTHDV